MKKNKSILKLVILFIFVAGCSSLGYGKTWLDLEGGMVMTGYNDVQIPSDSGTRFSLKDDIKPKNSFFYRIQSGYDFNDRHGIFILIAPLRIEGSSKLEKNINFQGVNFSAGTEVKSRFRFDSYRLGYVYTFYKTEDLKLGAGFTGKIRDAEISVEDYNGNKGIRTNTGFVPLIHFTAEWYFTKGFSLLLDGDGLAAPQGRAEDFLLALTYKATEDLRLKAGYRILEGGSDGGGKVYTFSMFHYIVLGLTYQF